MAPQAVAVSSSNTTDTAGSPDGLYVGGSAGCPLGFFGVAPVAQPSGNAQAALSRGLASGVIASYSTTQSPSAVTQGTTAEQLMTVQSGTGASMLVAANDLIYVNKPTAQAGLGYGNARVSSGGAIGVTFINVPAAGGSLTPTASEAYGVVAIRGLPKLSATLSPAAVAANSIVEQQFSVVGLPVGQLVSVSKPTQQAGLDIVGCRVISNNLLGISFVNVTSSPITPTASEAYLIGVLAGLDAIGNEIMYGFNVGTVGAIGVGVVASGGSSTLTGLLATDVVAGIMKPTTGANATNAAFVIGGVPTANTLSLYFGGIGTGATPTGSEVYGVRTVRMNPAAPLLLYSASIAPASVAAATTAEQTFTVTGLISGTPVWINKPSWTNGLGIAGVRVSATNTLAITFINSTSAAIVPPAESYLIGNFQVPLPGAGNCAYQQVSPVINSMGNLSVAQRSALVSMGLIAGA